MMNQQKGRRMIYLVKVKKDKLYLKRIKKQKKAELAALEIQRELEEFKKGE